MLKIKFIHSCGLEIFKVIFLLGSLFFWGPAVFGQGQMLPPSFRIPDSKIPGGFIPKEMSDTFKLEKPKIVLPDTAKLQQYIPPVMNSRNETPYYPSRKETPEGPKKE